MTSWFEQENHSRQLPKSPEWTFQTRGGHGFPKPSQGPTKPYPSMPCGQATPETA
jgi:hypothetical protein